MKIAIASDHRGIEYKAGAIEAAKALGHEALDMGAHDTASVDYPDFALRVAHAVAHGEAERGVLICGTGIGMSIAANKVKGIRAAACHDEHTVEMSRRHNDANVLCLGSTVVEPPDVRELVRHWLTTEFEGGRHARRLRKIARAESGLGSQTD